MSKNKSSAKINLWQKTPLRKSPNNSKMDDQKLKLFNAIAAFVQDLNTGFGKKYKPVALYNRLIEKITLVDQPAITRHIEAFKLFFQQNPDYITTKELTNGTVRYSDRIYLNIDNIIKRSDSNSHVFIHKHLITIYSLLNLGTKKGKAALSSLKESQASPAAGTAPTAGDSQELPDIDVPDTTEGRFIKDTLEEMTSQFENMDTAEANPMAMMAGMMQSGFFQKFMGNMQTKFSSGEMNLNSLLGTVTNVIGQATPEGSEESAQMKNFLDQSLGNVVPQMPPEVQPQMTQLMESLGGGGSLPIPELPVPDSRESREVPSRNTSTSGSNANKISEILTDSDSD